MLRHRIIPTLLLQNNKLVKTEKFKNPKYIGDPINAVHIFNEKEVDELILLDITATRENRAPNYTKINDIVSEAFMPIGYGGGINSQAQIDRLFKIGIEKVIINHAAYMNLDLLSQASKIYGNQSIVVALDTKKNIFGQFHLYSYSGQKRQKIDILEYLEKIQLAGCGEIYLNNINRDGTMSGYDLELINFVAPHCKTPLIVSGGAGKIEHFSEAINAGASAVSAGAMFVFQGVHRAVLISYPEYHKLEKLLN